MEKEKSYFTIDFGVNKSQLGRDFQQVEAYGLVLVLSLQIETLMCEKTERKSPKEEAAFSYILPIQTRAILGLSVLQLFELLFELREAFLFP